MILVVVVVIAIAIFLWKKIKYNIEGSNDSFPMTERVEVNDTEELWRTFEEDEHNINIDLDNPTSD